MMIRPAAVTDVPRLIVLFQREIEYQREVTPFFDIAPHLDWRRFAQAKLENLHERVLVAEGDGQLMGYIDVRVIYASRYRFLRSIARRLLLRDIAPIIAQPGDIGRIEDCYVEPQVRRQGIGSALVKDGLSWLQAQKVRRIELAVTAANGDGMAFWKRHGFSPFRLLMSKRMD
jgi:ribosomal protein S18 acetylase RimI-like enzyme